MKILLLCVLFMVFPAQADLRYNYKTEKYYSTHARMTVSESEYHVLALMSKSALDAAYEAGVSIKKTLGHIISALFDNGSPAALQLAEDLKWMFEYD